MSAVAGGGRDEVFIVSAGEHSDYVVLAVYSNRPAADAHVAANNEDHWFPDARVEAYELEHDYPSTGR